MTTKNLFANRATAKLSVDLASSDTAVTLVAGGGAWFPSPGANEFFRMVVQKGSGANDQREYMVCTSRLGDVLTVTRAQEGTPAANFTIGDEASLVVTAVSFDGLVQKVGQTLQSALEVEADPTTPLGIATKQFVEDTSIDEVPDDGLTYGREFGAWNPLGDAAGLPLPIPIEAGGTGGESLGEAQLNLIIGLTSIDDLAPATPKYGDRWIKPSNMTEMVWVPNQGGGGVGVWVNPADAQSEAYPISIAKGGTGAITAPAALTNLGGTTVGTGVFTAATQLAGRQALGIVDYTTTPFKLSDGTLAAPGLAWNSEPGLGFARTAANRVVLAALGTANFDFLGNSGFTQLYMSPAAVNGSARVLLVNQPNGVANYSSLILSIAADGTPYIASSFAGTGTAKALEVQAPTVNMRTGGGGVSIVANGPATNSVLTLIKTPGAAEAIILGSSTAGGYRWGVSLGGGGAETGGNAGSDFGVNRYSDTGAYLSTPIQIARSTGLVSFPHSVNFASGATGITAAMVGLNLVENARQVRAFETGTIYIGWGSGGNRLTLQVDNTYMGNTWPISIDSNAATASRTLQSDNCENWGYASGNFSLPYMRFQSSGSIRYLLYQTANDSTVYSLRTTTGNSVLEISGSGGAFGVGIAPCDIRLKTNVVPSVVNATAAINAMSLIAFDMFGQHSDIGFSAQNLKSINEGAVVGIEQPEDSPLHSFGTVYSPNTAAILAYVVKALQETIARVAALEKKK